MSETLTIVATTLFRKDVKRAKKRGLDLSKLQRHLDHLASRQPLPQASRDHALTGNYRGYRECHVEPDWLLIYRVVEEDLILIAFRTGTHSDLF